MLPSYRSTGTELSAVWLETVVPTASCLFISPQDECVAPSQIANCVAIQLFPIPAQ